MRGLIDLAIAETNTAYDLSGVDTYLRLVHAYRDPSYMEVSGNAFNSALNSVTGTTDGVMDDVHDKRTQFGADIVAMIIDDGQYCGIGWIGPYRANMFSVIAWNCATGFYSFGHEVGHNLGCLHDRGSQSECSASGYQYGYRDPNANFRSIMAYGCQSGQCDNNSGGFCSRAQVFSSSDPSLTINGLPIGNAQNDNARRINDVKSTVAAYYQFQAQCQSDSDCATTDLCSPGVCNGVCSYQPIDCDDNDVCTTDSCSAGNCINTPISCDDGNVCTTDTCDSVQGCIHTPILNCCGNGVCEAGVEDTSSCPEDCFLGPFDLETYLCLSCYIREGLMFDMEALDSDIEIRSLTMYSYTGQTAEVWTRPGTHVGFEYSSSGWTKVAEHTFSVGAFQTVEIPESSFTQTVTIPARSRQAFYLTFPGGQRQLYNFGQGSLNAVNVENEDLRIYEGPAKRYPFGSQAGPRVWNGVVTYAKAG